MAHTLSPRAGADAIPEGFTRSPIIRRLWGRDVDGEEEVKDRLEVHVLNKMRPTSRSPELGESLILQRTDPLDMA